MVQSCAAPLHFAAVLDRGGEVLVVEIGEGAELDAKLGGRLGRELALSEGLGGGLLLVNCFCPFCLNNSSSLE